MGANESGAAHMPNEPSDETPPVPQTPTPRLGGLEPDRRTADRRAVAPVVPSGDRGQRIRNRFVTAAVVVALVTSIAGLVVSRNTDSGTAGASTSAALQRIDSALAEIATAYSTLAAGNTAGKAALDRATARLNEAKAELGAGPTPTPTPTPSPSATPTPTPTPPSIKALLGMSAPVNAWNQRVSEVGPGLQARRLFYQSLTDTLGSKATDACNAGMYPVMSFKTGNYSWAQVASGQADSALRALQTRLNALPCPSFVAIHHEPNSDGTARDWSTMQVHALPILGGALGGKIQVGVIGNGFWWNTGNSGWTDAEIGAYITSDVKNVSDVIAGDTYQLNSGQEEPGPKMRNMDAWAARTGGVRALGVGEFNAMTAQGISSALQALGSLPRFAWGLLWNADLNGTTHLTGERLQVFRTALANW